MNSSISMKVVQLIRALGTHHTEYDKHNFIRRIIEKLGDEGYDLNSSFLLDSSETVQVLLKNQDIQEVMGMIKNCNLAFLGIGSTELEYSGYFKTGYINVDILENLQKLGGVGYICGLHFDDRSNPRCLDFENWVLTINRADLINIPVCIGVAYDPGKVMRSREL